MSYPGDHGQSGGRPPELYDQNPYGSSDPSVRVEPRTARETAQEQAYEPVYDAEADRTRASAHERHPQGPVPSARRNIPLLVGGGAVALFVLFGAGIVLSKALAGDGEPKNRPSTDAAPSAAPPNTTIASPLPTGPLGAMLTSRSTDPRLLTFREVFNRKTFHVGSGGYLMTTRHATRACTKTVRGAKLVWALRAGGCSQVLRGSFVTADGALIGTIGVANLKTAHAATLAQRAAAAKDAYLQPLPGGGRTKTLGNGIAFATAEARGHYLVLSWVQAPNGKAIPRNHRKAAAAFAPNVIYGSKLGFALQYRGIAGKPYGT